VCGHPLVRKIKGGLNKVAKTNLRQSSDVAILALNGRLSLGEALGLGPAVVSCLAEAIRELPRRAKRRFYSTLQA